jgi:hypothetical protein
MRILRFPKTIRLDLPDHLRQALDQVLEQHPEISNDDELLLQAIDNGIAAMNAGLKKAHEPPPTVETVAARMQQRLEDMARDAEGNSELSIAASLRPFPKITKRYKDPRREHVENYVGCPLDHDVQRRLQILVDAHPGEGLEHLVARLIDLGLEQAEQDPGALKPNPAEVFEGTTNTTKVAARSATLDRAFAMKDRLCHKLQAFIDAHPNVIQKPEALQLLLDLGLDRARDRPYVDLVEDIRQAARYKRLATARRR